ncbi:FAD-dependent oxidoreductase [Pseudonocardia humida]|uniref:FAD-dependent monooxygenase n=1 Tax=Pseudonocardia humida TaxID=2800819 RepID=A0ABT0ZSJ1_9PSEU|nr:FAD-dependent monooxygenase [Pseudonocardia humida]MCO1653669.1 FAD-dependent monooxygenase [Pseudonocardia humida]
MDVLIVGAGVGGLALARGLVADGHRVRVLERAPSLRAGGAAVTLASNGTAALAGLGVALDGTGTPLDRLDFGDHTGRPTSAVDLRVPRERTGFGFVSVSRQELVARIAEGLPEGTVRFGRRVEDVRVRGGRAVVEADGACLDADVVVGADGQGSAVRRAVLGGPPARDAGWATWQGLSPVLPELAGGHRGRCLVGPAGFVGLLPAGSGRLQWWFDVRRGAADPLPGSPVAMLRERFAGYAEPVGRLLAAVTDADVALYPHVLHRVPDAWGAGPTTLLGDAAHAFPPSQAQGANQALEDAWLLRRALRGGAVVPALRDYERRRARRVRRVSRLAASQVTNRPPARVVAALYRRVPPATAGRLYGLVIGSWSHVLRAA